MKKKSALITLASSAVLLGIYLINNSATIYAADTVNDQVPTNNNVINNQQTETNTQVQKIQQVQETNTSNTTQTTNQAYKQQNNYGLNDEALGIIREAGMTLSDFTPDQLAQIRKLDFDPSSVDSSTHWNYSHYTGTAKKMIDQDSRYRVPYFNAKKIKNMPATVTRDAQTGKKASLEIWDPWPVQDAKTGKIINYKGYQLMIAMMGIPKRNDAHIYLLYNKYNDNNFNHWKTAGPIFGFKAKKTAQEWSGSATVNKDGSIQLFYTDVDTSEGTNHQKISTVNLN